MKNKVKSIDFDTVFEAYNAYVFKIVINESDHRIAKEDIEELVSDIFFQLWKNQKKIKDLQKIKPYLGRIAKNTTKNKLRSLKKEVSFEENILDVSRNNDQAYGVKEQLKIIQQALQNMDELDKKIFLKYYYENKKIKEIAKSENIKTSTVKTKLHRTRKKLKRILEKRGFKSEY